MKWFLAVMFFKGALLEDPADLLHEQGPNSCSSRRFQFTSVDGITGLADIIRDFIEAIDVEEAGLEIEPAPAPAFVEELEDRLDGDPAFIAAFEALTPGRQREYNLNIAGARQSQTRLTRIEKHAPKIVDGMRLRHR